MNRIRISLIIPAYNEGAYLGGTLQSVMKAKDAYCDPSKIEIIVVNNCSTDETERIALEQGAAVVFEEERRIASVRNSGAEAATGEIIGFLDADSRVTPNIFNSIDESMVSGKYIGGGTMIRFDRNSLGLFCTYCITVIPARLLGVMAGLLFTERTTFEELGGFDETLYCAEDSKFALKLKRLGSAKGKKFKIITRDHVVTSTRAFDRFGDWHYFKNVPRVLLIGGPGAFKREDLCRRYWYDVER